MACEILVTALIWLQIIYFSCYLVLLNFLSKIFVWYKLIHQSKAKFLFFFLPLTSQKSLDVVSIRRSTGENKVSESPTLQHQNSGKILENRHCILLIVEICLSFIIIYHCICHFWHRKCIQKTFSLLYWTQVQCSSENTYLACTEGWDHLSLLIVAAQWCYTDNQYF